MIWSRTEKSFRGSNFFVQKLGSFCLLKSTIFRKLFIFLSKIFFRYLKMWSLIEVWNNIFVSFFISIPFNNGSDRSAKIQSRFDFAFSTSTKKFSKHRINIDLFVHSKTFRTLALKILKIHKKFFCRNSQYNY